MCLGKWAHVSEKAMDPTWTAPRILLPTMNGTRAFLGTGWQHSAKASVRLGRMTDRIIAALIIGVSLIVAGFAAGGRYAIASANNPLIVFVVDRYTGKVWSCWTGHGSRCTTTEAP